MNPYKYVTRGHLLIVLTGYMVARVIPPYNKGPETFWDALGGLLFVAAFYALILALFGYWNRPSAIKEKSNRRTFRQWLAFRMRRASDLLDRRNAPKHTGFSFTFENGRGAVLRQDGRGCPIMYRNDADYVRAHDEADGRTRKIGDQ